MTSSPKIDPHAEALRLLAAIPDDLRDELAEDPQTTIELLIEDIEIHTRPPAPPLARCAVDGVYHPGPPPRISIADDTTDARRRFTLLHELGHHLIEHDEVLADHPVPVSARRDEAICNEVAASILLPDDVVAAHLPAGKFTAEDVVRLYRARPASRAACCVAATRRLQRPGCVMVGDGDGVAHFTAHHLATNWAVARMTPGQPLLEKAGRVGFGHVREVTTVRFANDTISGELQGDAFVDNDGWVFAVLVEDTVSPWETGLRFPTADVGPAAEVIECPQCGPVTAWKTCRTCGDRECPSCGRCSCRVGPPERHCTGYCGLLKPAIQFKGTTTVCVDCE